jgi:hypothetical protein
MQKGGNIRVQGDKILAQSLSVNPCSNILSDDEDLVFGNVVFLTITFIQQ